MNQKNSQVKEGIDWFPQTITDNGAGKTNWFQLHDYMKNLETEARQNNFLGFLKNRQINDFFYRQTLKKHSDQLRHNIQTVWNCWINQYAKEEENLLALSSEITKLAELQEEIEYISKKNKTPIDVTGLKNLEQKEQEQFEMQSMLHTNSTGQVYRMFCKPALKSLEAIEKKDWKGLQESVRYSFDMTYV